METWEEFKNSSWFHSTYDAYPWNFVNSELLYEFSYTLSAL
jgi:hypothetical protein